VSAAAGAGVYFEERRGLLASLWLLLQAQVMSTESLPSELYAAICDFNADLLAAAGSDGRSLLLKRLAELVRVSPELGPLSVRVQRVSWCAEGLCLPVGRGTVQQKYRSEP
jgi:hypothetical protein